MLTFAHMLFWLACGLLGCGLLGYWSVRARVLFRVRRLFSVRRSVRKMKVSTGSLRALCGSSARLSEILTQMETQINRIEVETALSPAALIEAIFRAPRVARYVPETTVSRSSPPLVAEFLLCLFARKKDTVTLVGDLQEYFSRDLDAGISVRRAKARYWARVLGSIGPQVWQMLLRVGRDVTRLS
jgi:hypothetical protein